MVYSVNSALVLDCRHFTYSPRRKTDRHRIALCCLSRHVNCVETIENFPVAQEGQLMEPTLLGKEGSGNDGLPRGACGGAQRDGHQIERDGVPLPLVDKAGFGARQFGIGTLGAHSRGLVRNATQVSTFGVLKESSASRCPEVPSPHFSPGAVMIAEDFGPVVHNGHVRVLATESIAGTTVEGACARTARVYTGTKDPRGRGQRSPPSVRSSRSRPN